MTEPQNVIDELEQRLIHTFYEPAGRRASVPVRRWVPAAGALALIATILVLALGSGSLAPPTAFGALQQAADAAATTPTLALGPSKVWSAQIIRTTTFGQTPPSGAERPVPVRVRVHEDVTITQTGRLIDHTTYTYSFLHPRDARLFGNLYRTPIENTTTTTGHGKLPSPLLPTVPLLSYQALKTLPTQPLQLRTVINRLINAAFATATSGSKTDSRAQTTASTSGGVTVVGACCGTGSQTRHDVATMSMIAWLLALPVHPAVRAALYRIAATLPGVRYDGTIHDALGRPGVEISIGASNDQLRMIFDARTSALLATSTGFGSAAARQGFGAYTSTLQSAQVRAR